MGCAGRVSDRVGILATGEDVTTCNRVRAGSVGHGELTVAADDRQPRVRALRAGKGAVKHTVGSAGAEVEVPSMHAGLSVDAVIAGRAADNRTRTRQRVLG